MVYRKRPGGEVELSLSHEISVRPVRTAGILVAGDGDLVIGDVKIEEVSPVVDVPCAQVA